MNKPASIAGDKFRRYRARKKAKGLREIRMWVPDINSPGFAEEAERQAALLRGAPEEREALDFIEAVMADTMKDHPYIEDED